MDSFIHGNTFLSMEVWERQPGLFRAQAVKDSAAHPLPTLSCPRTVPLVPVLLPQEKQSPGHAPLAETLLLQGSSALGRGWRRGGPQTPARHRRSVWAQSFGGPEGTDRSGLVAYLNGAAVRQVVLSLLCLQRLILLGVYG